MEPLLKLLAASEKRYDELAVLIADPEIASDYQKIYQLSKERSHLEREFSFTINSQKSKKKLKKTPDFFMKTRMKK